jgi:hypothetical protein
MLLFCCDADDEAEKNIQGIAVVNENGINKFITHILTASSPSFTQQQI